MNGRDLINPKVKDFIDRLVLMKAEAGELELWETMHALETPIKAVGWEVEKKIDRAMRKEFP